jgi:hypothetical protein
VQDAFAIGSVLWYMLCRNPAEEPFRHLAGGDVAYNEPGDVARWPNPRDATAARIVVASLLARTQAARASLNEAVLMLEVMLFGIPLDHSERDTRCVPARHRIALSILSPADLLPSHEKSIVFVGQTWVGKTCYSSISWPLNGPGPLCLWTPPSGVCTHQR